ncbi:Mitochondrial import receptor subunit TOM40 1 [Orchesella cincta]|uniref:Mitochondrial import receptor subunit TOM40 1 n=1 Tax=Orchesella cincta TaxID=48709 RepID=A0A1D2NJ26_ORCCI|nr:Mitochondrial import receptor subunit TOM40 1 [Orchesella cincta]
MLCNATTFLIKMGLGVSKCEAAPDPTILLPPPPPGTAAPRGAPEAPVVNEKFKNNPGSYEDLSKKCKEIFPQPFEGAKVMINKSLNQGFHVSHTLTMSLHHPSGYRLNDLTSASPAVTPERRPLVLLGEHGPQREALKTKFVVQVMNSKFAGTQFGLDFKGRDFTASATLANFNLFSETGIGVVHFLQAITPKLCVGAELMYQQAPQIPGGAATALTCSGRLTTDESIWSAFAGTNNLGMSYYRRLNEEIQIGVELENSYQQQQFIAAIGYQFELPKANFSMKAMIDNNWTVTGVLEKRLLPMPFLLSVCGSLNHVKNQFRLGCGFSIGA